MNTKYIFKELDGLIPQFFVTNLRLSLASNNLIQLCMAITETVTQCNIPSEHEKRVCGLLSLLCKHHSSKYRYLNDIIKN